MEWPGQDQKQQRAIRDSQARQGALTFAAVEEDFFALFLSVLALAGQCWPVPVPTLPARTEEHSRRLGDFADLDPF